MDNLKKMQQLKNSIPVFFEIYSRMRKIKYISFSERNAYISLESFERYEDSNTYIFAKEMRIYFDLFEFIDVKQNTVKYRIAFTIEQISKVKEAAWVDMMRWVGESITDFDITLSSGGIVIHHLIDYETFSLQEKERIYIEREKYFESEMKRLKAKEMQESNFIFKTIEWLKNIFKS